MAKDLLNSELYDLCCNAFRREDEQSFKMIRRWFESNADNHERLKSAENYTDHYHTTPLHRVLGSRTPLDIVEALITHAPETVRNVDDGGRLPLHIACYRGASLEVLNLLIQVYPESYNVKSILDKKPSDFLKEWAQNAHGNVPILLLQEAIVNGFSEKLVKLLLEAFPESCMEQDKNGMIPLHHAYLRGNSMRLLIHAYPEGASVKDKQGNIPSNYDQQGKNASVEISSPASIETPLTEITIADVTVIFKNSELYDLCCNAFRREDEQSFNMIRRWFEINKDNHESLKSAENYTGHYHTTPLHRILGSHTPLDIVERFIEHVPESVRNVDDGGRLPLHIACYRGASLEVINLLIQVYPESYNVMSILDKRPSDFLKEWAQNTHGNEHVTMLHNAAARGFSVNLLRLLLVAFPNCSKVQDKNGMLPLHHACGGNNANDIMSTVKNLLDANPEGVRIPDNIGRTPSQLLEPLAARRDETGMLLLHHQAASSSGFDDDILSFLFGAYPEGIATPDKCGMLPLHHACLNQASSLDTLILFLKLYPESLFFSL